MKSNCAAGSLVQSTTSNLIRSPSPAAFAFARARSSDPACASKPKTLALGNADAIAIAARPLPQPTSSDDPPSVNFATTCGIAGSHLRINECRYIEADERSIASHVSGGYSLCATPRPSLNDAITFGAIDICGTIISMKPPAKNGESSRASTIACSAGIA